jgi:two-component system CAI-1 autoinducer sensor kinase/phosphatase CqsS
MTNQNLNPNLDQIKNLKSLAASIAHETKNPLSAIKGFCKIIRGNLDEVVEWLDLIAVSSARGLLMIEMILQNVRDEEIDVTNFVGLSIANVVNLAIKEYGFGSDFERGLVNVDLENDFNFKGDETLMIFVLFNLLKNSLYYRAKINIWLDGDKKCLYFKDNAVGIAADKLEFIFDSFFTSNKKGGTGLGLPFCRRVMLAFGGDITCESKEGEGAEFCLRFK